MKLLVRMLGSPVPQEVPCTAGQSVGELLAALAAGNDNHDAQQDHHKLVSGRSASGRSTAAAHERLAALDGVLMPSHPRSLRSARGLQVYRGRVLHNTSAKLGDVVADGDVLVLLPRRSVAPRPPPPELCRVRLGGRSGE